MIVREELEEICPHCDAVIGEKGLYRSPDGRWHHRGCDQPVDRAAYEAAVDARRSPAERRWLSLPVEERLQQGAAAWSQRFKEAEAAEEAEEGKDPSAEAVAAAKTLGEKLQVDWDKADFTPEDLALGLDVEREHDDVTDGDEQATARIALAHLRERPDYYQRLRAFVEGDDDPASGHLIEITRTVIKISAEQALEKTAYAHGDYGKPRTCPGCGGDVYGGDRMTGSKFRGSYMCEQCRQSWSGSTAKAFPHKDAEPKRIFTIAVDLDGTVATEEEDFDPKTIGAPRTGVRKWLKLFKKLGARLVLWTVRGDRAQLWDYVRKHDLPFDCINENPDQPEDSSGKLIADVYVDNRAVNAAGAWPRFGPKVLDRLRAA